jgi:VWFA-related protein
LPKFFTFMFLSILIFQSSAFPGADGAVNNQNSSPGSTQAPSVVAGTYALKVDVDSVFLNVSVRERETNRSLSGLQKEDFAIFEDGIRQEIDQFLPTESPFDLLLLLDISGSTAPYLKLIKQAAIEFTREIGAQDRVAVATFNSKVKLIQKYTNDRDAAEKAISRIKSGGGTAFYDALSTSVTQFKSDAKARSAIIVFTDGIDNGLEGIWGSGSRTTFEELYRKIQESDAIIYTIFLNTEDKLNDPQPAGGKGSSPSIPSWPGGRNAGKFPGGFPFPLPFPMPGSGRHSRSGDDNLDSIYRQARDQLQTIADETGGRMYSPRKLDELSDAYSEIADDLRIQYQVGYNSTNLEHDGGWRKIHVKIDNYPDAVVRTRRGYFAVGSPQSATIQ